MILTIAQSYALPPECVTLTVYLNEHLGQCTVKNDFPDPEKNKQCVCTNANIFASSPLCFYHPPPKKYFFFMGDLDAISLLRTYSSS
jgi:hypothetical protein